MDVGLVVTLQRLSVFTSPPCRVCCCSRDDRTMSPHGSCPNDVYIVRPNGAIERIVITEDFLAEDALYVVFACFLRIAKRCEAVCVLA